MDEKSFISPVVDIFRAILYDIVGLFLPGAALLLVLRESSFAVIRHFVEPLTKIENNTKLALFIGASYVAGYAVQGFGGRFWSLIVVRIVNGAKTWWRDQKLRKPHNRVNEEEHNPHEVVQAGAAQQLVKGEEGMKGISPAFLQVKSQLESSELFRSLRTQIGEYCDVATPDKLSSNEVQNLAYSVADDRAANAFTFSYRADLSNGMFFVFLVAALETLFAYWRLETKVWLATLVVYGVLAFGFALRAWTYFDIRGRIIYPIGLAVLADYRREQKSSKD
ncbi:MAG TPA: hypothetical protein VN956_26890 [Pyrinomonadaceae bacterium]|nr:hypothetical protein [Pyrinomonadaceae bacterium]